MARILTIDDDQFIRTLLSVQLGERGHEVLEADSGDAGLALAQVEQPDLVLLDLGLPGMDGAAVLSALRADPATANIPVVVVSAWGDGGARTMALEHGAAAVVRKPFDVDELRVVVARVLRAIR